MQHGNNIALHIDLGQDGSLRGEVNLSTLDGADNINNEVPGTLGPPRQLFIHPHSLESERGLQIYRQHQPSSLSRNEFNLPHKTDVLEELSISFGLVWFGAIAVT